MKNTKSDLHIKMCEEIENWTQLELENFLNLY